MLGGQYSSRYEQIELLGRNPQDDSQMFLVKDTQTQSYRMAKKLSLEDSSLEQQAQMLNEVTLLKELQHPHILRYYDIHLEGDTVISLLEFCEEGDLANYLQKKKNKKEGLSEKLLLSWLMQLLMGLEHIHSQHIIHRLIASQNVYLNHQGDLKIGSFGSAKRLESTLKKALTVVTAPCNMSPQMVEGHPYTTKVDIWALGCLIYEMAAFKPLYTYTNLPQLYDLIVERPSPDLPANYGKYLNPIYRKMMKKNPLQRPSASELLQEEVFVRLMKEYIRKKKIDSLDLKYLVPKRLTIHKVRSKKKEGALKLPPISPSLLSTKKDHPKSNRGRVSHSKTQKTESRSLSREGKKSRVRVEGECGRMQQSDEVGERITCINEKEGYTISQLCQAKLCQILSKYKPQMGQICQKTYEFDSFEQQF